MRPVKTARQLNKYQNKYLRTIAEAYKTTSTRILEMEIYISSLNIYLNSRIAAFRQQLKISEIGLAIERAYERLKIRFRNRKGRRRRAKITSGQFKNQ
jgi:hypothetical protein